MKKRTLSILILILSFLIGACAAKEDAEDKENLNEEISTNAHKGSRTAPYEFGETIIISTKSQFDNDIVEYKMCFGELWDSEKVKKEYSQYSSLEDRIIVRGTVDVICDTTDDEIRFDLQPTFITESLNEEGAQIESYKSNELNNWLNNVYSGGTYDIIVLGKDNGIASLKISYLKIDYINLDGKTDNIWIKIPENTSDTSIENNNIIQNSNKVEETTVVADLSSELTYEELESKLLQEPMYIEKTEYIVQHESYKALYPDLLQAIIKNNSGTDIKNAVIAFAAWDKNGFPVKIETQTSLGRGSYIARCSYSDINLVNGATYGEEGGLPLDSDMDKIAIFKAIVVSYTDFEGNTWENPAGTTFCR